MKELYAIHDKINARGIEVDPDEQISFSRDVMEDIDMELPEDIRADIEAFQKAVAPLLPEDFDYYAFVGSEEPPAFDLEAGIEISGVPISADLDSEQSLFQQLKDADWEALRAKARVQLKRMQAFVRLIDMKRPARSAKQAQREFREETKDFVKEKRRDASQIHILWWDDAEGLMEKELPDGDELRKQLPSLLYDGGELLAIVAFGKPLPVERIDALTAEARRSFDKIFEKASELANATGDWPVDHYAAEEESSVEIASEELPPPAHG